MKQTKFLFVLALLCLQVQSIRAYDFKVDGIGYNIISVSNLEVEAEGAYGDNNYWKEVVVIPECVNYQGMEFRVTAIKGSVFTQGYGNSILKEVYLPNTIKEIPTKCFLGCKNLVKVKLPNELLAINEEAFRGCSSLENLKIPSGVSIIGSHAFQDCKNLNNIELPPNAEYVGDGIFMGCTNLTSIFIPQNFGCKESDGLLNAFRGCKRLKNVVFDENYKGSKRGYLGPQTFYQCDSLESVQFSNNVNLGSIGWRTFYECSLLTNITLPQNIQNLSEEAFYGCTQLRQVVSPNNTPPKIDPGAKPFSSTTWLNGILYVPQGCVSIYRNSEGWKEFVNIREIGNEEVFPLSVYCNEGGSVMFAGLTVRNQVVSINTYRNQSVTLTITPDDGYEIKSVTLNGTDVIGDLYNNTYTIAQIKENIVFRVEFARTATYLSLKQPTGSMDIVVKEGERQTIRIVPESGNTIHSVTYNGADVTSQLSDDNVFVTPEITENSVLYVTYENGENPPVNQTKYLSIKHSENGTVKQKITLGRSYTYKITPVNGQILSALYFNGVDVTSEIKGDKFTTPVLNDNATLEVEFKAK